MTPDEVKAARERMSSAVGYSVDAPEAVAQHLVADLALALAALDEARRERDEARQEAQACTPECEAMQTRLLGAQMLADQRTIERDAARERMSVYRAERDEARGQLALALAWGAEACGGFWGRAAAHFTRQRDEAREALASLLDGHLSPSDAVRADAITRAAAARRGWGM